MAATMAVGSSATGRKAKQAREEKGRAQCRVAIPAVGPTTKTSALSGRVRGKGYWGGKGSGYGGGYGKGYGQGGGGYNGKGGNEQVVGGGATLSWPPPPQSL